MSRSVARSERLMMSMSGSRPPTTDRSAGCSTLDMRRCRIVSTLRTMSGDVRSIAAIRCATSACSAGGSLDRTQRCLLRGQVREDQGDRLRVLVLQEAEQLPGVGTSEELERQLRDRGLEPSHDLAGPLAAEPLLEQLPRVAEPALGRPASRRRGLDELLDDGVRDLRLDVLQPGDLGDELLHLGLRQDAQDARGLLLPELHEQDRCLAQPGQLRGPRVRHHVTDHRRSSRGAAGRPRRAGARPDRSRPRAPARCVEPRRRGRPAPQRPVRTARRSPGCPAR